MTKHVYTAIFRIEKDGYYSVNFPNIEGCNTSVPNLYEALEMANDILCLILYHKEQKREIIPAVSDIRSLSVKK